MERLMETCLSRILNTKSEAVMNIEMKEWKKVVEKLKEAQGKIQLTLKNQEWIDEAKRYTEKHRKELKKVLNKDFGKLKSFIEDQKGELEKIQKKFPSEVKKFKGFVEAQRKELEKLLHGVKTKAKTKGAPSPTKAKKKVTKKAGKTVKR